MTRFDDGIIDVSRVVLHLRGLADGSIEPRLVNSGLCNELWVVFGIEIARLWFDFISEFEYFSGSVIFPIAGSDDDPIIDYSDFCESVCNMWDASTEYGRRRLLLCSFIADELEKRYTI